MPPSVEPARPPDWGQLMSHSAHRPDIAGLPAAIAAAAKLVDSTLEAVLPAPTQVAYPDRQCVAFVGDGGFSMLMADFVSAVKYQLPIKVVIVKNNTLGQIKWEQMVFLGNPEYGVELQPIDFVKFAEACGARGFCIDDPKECGRILDEALSTPGPVIIEAVVDPFEPPMPPKITVEQARHFAESLVRGEPNRGKIALTALSDKVRELV